jgi:hypothetical protein
MIVTTNLPFESWTEVLGSERLTGATLDRLTHRCRIIETKGESYRLHDAKKRNQPRPNPDAVTLPTSTNDRIFGEDNNQADWQPTNVLPLSMIARCQIRWAFTPTGKKEVAIPISAVTGVDSDGVRLNLKKDDVRDLAPVELDHPEW